MVPLFSSDGAVKAANGEASWRVELRNLDGHVPLAPTYATRHERARPDRDGTFADPLDADDTPLPFGRCEGSVTYTKTSSGLRETSMLATMGAIACLLPGDERSMIPHLGTARYERPRRRPPASRKGIARSRDTRGMGAPTVVSEDERPCKRDSCMSPERFVRTVRAECFDWLLILNRRCLERVLARHRVCRSCRW
jgi:hypothetical protein